MYITPRVYKLEKSLSDPTRSWLDSFSNETLQHGFIKSALNYSPFIFMKGNVITWLLIYVDDIIKIRNNFTHII